MKNRYILHLCPNHHKVVTSLMPYAGMLYLHSCTESPTHFAYEVEAPVLFINNQGTIDYFDATTRHLHIPILPKITKQMIKRLFEAAINLASTADQDIPVSQRSKSRAFPGILFPEPEYLGALCLVPNGAGAFIVPNRILINPKSPKRILGQ